MKKIAIGITSILSAGCLMGAVLSLNPATASANTANISMVDGASVRLSSYKSGIGFTTRVNYDYYNTLDESYDVITGTLILPTDYLTANEITEVTHATLTEKGEAGVFFQDVVNQGWKNTATAEKDGYYEYRGSLVNLNKSNYDREFSAVGYVGYKTESDAEYTYEYTAYDMEKNSRAIDDVAFKAYVDRTAKEQTVDGVDYKYAVEKDGTYSRYTNDELGILSGYMRTMSVTDTKTAIVQDEDGSLDYTSLKALATDSDFNANAITSVTRNGKNIEFTNSAVDVSLNGVYNVTLKGEATHTSGAIVPATYTMNVDVWSEATKNVMISVDDMRHVGGYSEQNTTTEKYTVGTYTVDGKEGTYYMIDVEGVDATKKATLESSVMIAKPLHSLEYYKAYYKQLQENNPYLTYNVSMSWYLDNSKNLYTDTGDAPMYSIFSDHIRENERRDVWLGGSMDLGKFIDEYYTEISDYYDTVVEEMAKIHSNEISKFGRFVDVKGVKRSDGTMVYGYLTTNKLVTKMNTGYFTPMTIGVEGIKTYESTVLVDRNNESTIKASLSESEQEVVTYWENNGYSISYEFVKRYSDGTPISTANAITSLATYTIDSTVEDGIYYLNVVVMKGEISGVCLSKAYDIYGTSKYSDGTEKVEYENFKHSDSKYSVQAYYSNSRELWMEKTINVRKANYKSILTGPVLDVDFIENYDEANVNNALYVFNIGTPTTLAAGNYKELSEVGYLEIDWVTKSAYSYIDSYNKTYNYNGGYHLATYILPRHSKAYYEAFANESGNCVRAFKGSNSGFRYLNATNIVGDEVELTYQKVWSGGDQVSAVNTAMKMNVQTLIDNYESFATAEVPMFVVFQPQDSSASSGITRIYEIFFARN